MGVVRWGHYQWVMVPTTSNAAAAVSSEDWLCDILKWSLWSTKLLGYNVLSISAHPARKGRALVLNSWYSLSRWYPILHNVLFISLVWYSANMRDVLVQEYIPSTGTTEYIILGLCSTLFTCTSVIYKILANVNAKSTLAFCKHTTTLFDYMASHGVDVRQQTHVFETYTKSARKRLLIYVTCTCCGVGAVGIVYPLLAYFLRWKYYNSSQPPPVLMALLFLYRSEEVV